MSDVVWCDLGGHLMSAADPDRKFWTPNNDPYHTDQTQARMDACGKHQRAGFIPFPDLLGPRDLEESPKELPKAPEGKRIVDEKEYQEYMNYLESQNTPGESKLE